MKQLLVILLLAGVIFAKTVPSAIWKQDDMASALYGSVNAAQKILICSRSSDFKNEVIDRIADTLKSDSVSVQMEGISYLKQVKTEKYAAIVIVNTCMAWEIDNKVQTFLKEHPDYPAVILLTTSGDPKRCGKGKHIPQGVDAISSASVDAKVVSVADEIVTLIQLYLKVN